MVGSDARGSIGDMSSRKGAIEPIDWGGSKTQVSPKSKHTIAETIQAKGIKIGILGIMTGVVVWVWPIFQRLVLWRIDLLPAGPKIIAYSVLVIVLAILLRIIIPFVSGLFLD